MDFSKVFDKVPHGRLVNKVRSHRILGELAIWIQNWLKARSVGGGLLFRLETCDQRYATRIGTRLLFIIYRNDLNVNVGGMV
eukprot:g17489.t1